MTRFLLDVNVLIALIDPAHVQHDKAHEWFAKTGWKAWATFYNRVGVVKGHV